MGTPNIFTKEQIKFVGKNYKDKTSQELANLVNQKFETNFTQRQILGLKNQHKWKTGLISRFRKGHEPHNKGKKMSAETKAKLLPTLFKKGHLTKRYRPVGTERIESKDKLIEVKVYTKDYPNNCYKITRNGTEGWIKKHVKVWLDAGREIPKGYNICFLNQNKRDFRIENLVCLSNKELRWLNTHYGWTKDNEVNKAITSIVKLKCKLKEVINEDFIR